MKQRGRPPGTTKPPTYRVQVQIDAPMPRLSRVKRLEWLVGKLLAMIEDLRARKLSPIRPDPHQEHNAEHGNAE